MVHERRSTFGVAMLKPKAQKLLDLLKSGRLGPDPRLADIAKELGWGSPANAAYWLDWLETCEYIARTPKEIGSRRRPVTVLGCSPSCPKCGRPYAEAA